jgi:hypothetical protein
VRNGIKQAHTKGDKKQNYQQPGEYEPALIVAWRGRGNTKNKMDAAKDRGEELYQFISSES